MGENIYDHLIATGDWGSKFRCTPLIIDIFKRRQVFFGFEATCSREDVLHFADGVTIEPYTMYRSETPLWSMGSFSDSNSAWPKWPLGVRIGRYSSIGRQVSPMGARHTVEWACSSALVYRSPSAPEGKVPWMLAAHRDFNDGVFDSGLPPKPIINVDITIEHDVWIGDDVRLAQQVVIGTGSVIGTGAVVTRNVEPYMIVGGVPARVLRPRFKETLIEKFLESKWWEFGPNIWKLCDYKNPEKFVDDVARVREERTITPFNPEKITFRHILNDLMDRV